jgi:mRNA-degrading endonuclease toxin of MazEF toxin-antitoxin module
MQEEDMQMALRTMQNGLRENWCYRRGDLYIADLNPYVGSEQGGVRPVLVLQNDDGNYHCPTLIIAPMTTRIKKPNQPTHYYIDKAQGLVAPSMAQLEQIRTIDKHRVKRYLGKISKAQMEGIDEIIKCSLGLYIPEDVEAP